MAYSEKALNYFYNPMNVGKITDDVGVSHVLFGSPETHLVVNFDVKIQDGLIVDAKFKAYGGVNVIAGASFITEYVRNKSVNEVKMNLDSNLLMKEMDWSGYEMPIALTLLMALNKVIV